MENLVNIPELQVSHSEQKHL